jgi:hypothetical protein
LAKISLFADAGFKSMEMSMPKHVTEGEEFYESLEDIEEGEEFYELLEDIEEGEEFYELLEEVEEGEEDE